MSNIRTEFGFERTECDCEECIQFCVNLPGSLIPGDLESISGCLGYDDLVQFAVENLLASPGAIVSDGKSLIRIPTLVPQRGPDGACKFLCDFTQKMASGGSKRWVFRNFDIGGEF